MEKHIIEKLSKIETEYLNIQKELQDPEIFKDPKKMTSLNKREGKLKQTYSLYKEYKDLENEILESEKIIEIDKDLEIQKEFKQIINDSKKRMIELEKEIMESLIEKDPSDEKNAIIEIKGAAGGDEANIFVGDLFEMYQRYATKNNMSVEVEEESRGESGGFTHIKFIISGINVYGKFKYESGVHRVQRVPSTETQGRVHTSTVTVLVVPEAEEVDVQINNSDLRIDTYRASGAGGQHVNKTDSAVRITHIPTGVVVASQEGRSQHDNKERALQEIRNKLYLIKIQEKQNKDNDLKKSLIGSGDRSEKIRTYNYPQNRVTDHRINLTIKKLDRIMDGDLGEVIDVLVSIGKQEQQ